MKLVVYTLLALLFLASASERVATNNYGWAVWSAGLFIFYLAMIVVEYTKDGTNDIDRK